MKQCALKRSLVRVPTFVLDFTFQINKFWFLRKQRDTEDKIQQDHLDWFLQCVFDIGWWFGGIGGKLVVNKSLRLFTVYERCN